MFELDVTGLPCPMPLIKLKKVLASEAVLGVLVTASDAGVLKDIPAFCVQQGLRCVILSETLPYQLSVERVASDE